MTDPTLDAIQQRLEKATKGPWVADFAPPSGAMIYAADDKRVADVLERVAERPREECADNAMFIAHAPEDIAFLLQEVERLEGEHADCVPRSRYNCANDDWLKSEAKLAHVQEVARTEIEGLEAKLAQAERVVEAVIAMDNAGSPRDYDEARQQAILLAKQALADVGKGP